MWKPLDLNLKYTIHRQVLGDDPTNIDNRLNIWDYIVSVARTEKFIQDAENGVRVDNNKLKLGAFLTEDTVINGHTRQFNLSLLALKGFSVQANQFNILSPLTVITSGTNGTSGIKFTNINSSTTPVSGQPLGVDADGNIVVVNFSSPTCDDVNFLVNSITYKALTCGVDFDLNVVDADDNPVGTIELPDVLRIANSEVDIAGVYTEYLLAESNLTINVTRDSSSYTPTYDDATKTINVDCPPADDVTVELNSVLVETLSPGDNLSLTTTLDGVSHPATYTAGVINLNTPAPSGYAPRPLDLPSQLPIVNNGDSGWARSQGAFAYNIPYASVGLYELDPTHPDGDVLMQQNSFGNTARFTNLTGTKDATFNASIVCGDGVTRTILSFIDHYYGVVIHVAFGTGNTGTYTTQCARAFNASYDGIPVYFANVGMCASLGTYTVQNSHIARITGNSGGMYIGEMRAGTIQVYTVSNGLVQLAVNGTYNYGAVFFSKYNP